MLGSRRFTTIVGGDKASAHYSGTARDCLRLETSLINGTRDVFSMSKRDGLRRIKDDVWECSYYPSPGAGRKWKRVRASSKREAMIARLKLMEMRRESIPNNLEDLPFEEARRRLEVKCKTDGNSFRTIYHNLLPKFDSLFGRFLSKEFPTIASLSQFKGSAKAIFEQYHRWVVVDCGRSAGWRDELGKIKSIFAKLHAIGFCDASVLEILKTFKKPKANKKQYKPISKDQQLTLLSHIKADRPDYYGITYMAMRLGWRRGQIIAIKNKNIEWAGLRPIAIYCEPGDMKTKEPFKLDTIDGELATIIKNSHLMSKSQNSDWLFPNRNGRKHHANHYTEYMAKVSEKVLGLHLSPHDFRHSFCTTRLAEGCTEEDVMAITGHRTRESFRIYTHRTSEGVKKVVANSKLFD
jgi:integrase